MLDMGGWISDSSFTLLTSHFYFASDKYFSNNVKVRSGNKYLVPGARKIPSNGNQVFLMRSGYNLYKGYIGYRLMWTEPDSNRRPHHCPDPDLKSGSRMLDEGASVDSTGLEPVTPTLQM